MNYCSCDYHRVNKILNKDLYEVDFVEKHTKECDKNYRQYIKMKKKVDKLIQETTDLKWTLFRMELTGLTDYNNHSIDLKIC